ncbi:MULTISPECIES: protein-export chaperone SecB [unclassified Beijerinckia]|uniref:protein-export chaperone SecB n=1 Tax=unclassified Beijerinckia TaxID=2638183 RepID=UPI0008988B45|nr:MULTISPECIES: protein-export chaperone SecB [unclassified Beijerinckia]MDH7797993.1 preprotein translocase subunit SecB [Beijerinckia sp. GAS462]SED05326.1 protein translocase subunit secB [Beijerinckia sp. 28-YEA-48]
MAENGSNGAANGANGGALPQLNVLVQYTKDLSFENPNAPRSLAPQGEPPNISIQVNVNANQINETDFDVNLMLEGSAGEGANVLFKFELTYGGVFKLQHIPENEIHPVVWIECPRLLFPFARQIVADAVRNGGFPPLLLDPIDFVALYRQRMEQLQAAGATA